MFASRIARAGAAAAVAIVIATSGVAAGEPETAWFNGHQVAFRIPSGDSSNPNQFVFGCFTVGPDLTGHRAAPAPIMYAVVNDYATGHHCPGDPTQLRHDHVLSTAPGYPGYNGSWSIVLALPGPNFTPAAMPYTSAAAVLAGVAAGQLVLVDAGFRTIAPVSGH